MRKTTIDEKIDLIKMERYVKAVNKERNLVTCWYRDKDGNMLDVDEDIDELYEDIKAEIAYDEEMAKRFSFDYKGE